MPTFKTVASPKPFTISATPTITAGAYSAADAVGGLITFADAAYGDGRGNIRHFIVIDDADQGVELELHLFDRTFTATADNAAFAPSDDDLENYIGFVQVLTTSYANFSTNQVATTTNYDFPFNLAPGGTSLFGQLVTRGTPTYAAVDDLTVKLVIMRYGS